MLAKLTRQQGKFIIIDFNKRKPMKTKLNEHCESTFIGYECKKNTTYENEILMKSRNSLSFLVDT